MTSGIAADASGGSDDVIRVVVVDDQTLVRRGLRELLRWTPDIHVVADAGDGAEALRVIDEHRPDVGLLDVQLPRLTASDVLRQLSAAGHALPAILFAPFDDDEALI